MRKALLFATLVALVAGMSSCSMFKKDTFSETDLFGYWQEDGTEAFLCFTNEKNETGEYADYKYYGYEWNEAEEVMESDVLADKHGNGWFMWSLNSKDLKELHLMSNKGSVIPKKYTILKLTDTELHYQDEFGRYAFNKVVHKK